MDFSQAWQLLLNIYYKVASAGYEGCVVAFVVGIILEKKGVAMTGRKERYTGRQTYGDNIDVTHHPAIEGTAQSFVGQLIGTLLTWSGVILIFISVIAFANIAIYGVPRGYN
jgi:hypothetical protein